MPRLRASKRSGWQPLILDHDFTERVDDATANEITQPPDPTKRTGGLVVFIETAISMAQARPLGDYSMDISKTSVAVLFYLKSKAIAATDEPHLDLSRMEDLPTGGCTLLGSNMTLPDGPAHGQRMLYMQTDESVFTIILWCSIAANWSHVVTFHDGGTYAKAFMDAKDWNESTMLLMNSHANQSTALSRLFKVGTGKVLGPESIIASLNRVDPFQKYINTRPPAVQQAAVVEEIVTPQIQIEGLYNTETPSDHVTSSYPQYYTQPQYAVPWSSLPGYGAVQWPQELLHAYNAYTHYGYAVPYGYSGHYTAHQVHKSESPTTTRLAIRETARQMSAQANERNKSQPEYRTVLHDPFKAENKMPSPLPKSPYALATPVSVGSLHFDSNRTVRAGHLIESPLATRQKKPDIYNSMPERADRSSAVRITRPSFADQYTRQNFSGGFFSDDHMSPAYTNTWKKPQPALARDRAIDEWWWSGSSFSRHEDYHHTVEACGKTLAAVKGEMLKQGSNVDSRRAKTVSRALVPVLENLESYITGPISKRRDYWTPWKPAAEWCCDRSAEGAKSFFDKDWGCPPARIARDARYNPVV